MAPPEINRLGKRLGVRQQPLATAQVYIKRFYTRVEIRRTNPYLVITTALYLACKMEESPQHIRLLSQEARSLWSADFQGHDTSRIGECEFSLISEMNSQLIVHQPYRTLLTFQDEFGLTQEETSLAWTVINDHYMTDLPLLHPPHVIALTAVLMALVLRPSSNAPNAGAGGGNTNTAAGAGAGGVALAATALAQAQMQAQARAAGNVPGTPGLTSQASQQGFSQGTLGENPGEFKKTTDPRLAKVQHFAMWLAESSIDIEAMIDCTQELISFYECHEQYNEKHTKEQISRFIKARGLDK